MVSFFLKERSNDWHLVGEERIKWEVKITNDLDVRVEGMSENLFIPMVIENVFPKD